MFFVLADKVEDGKTYTSRVGKSTLSYDTARNKAMKCKGFIVNESRKLIGQAMDPSMPKYVGDLKNIGSGEDSYA